LSPPSDRARCGRKSPPDLGGVHGRGAGIARRRPSRRGWRRNPRRLRGADHGLRRATVKPGGPRDPRGKGGTESKRPRARPRACQHLDRSCSEGRFPFVRSAGEARSGSETLRSRRRWSLTHLRGRLRGEPRGSPGLDGRRPNGAARLRAARRFEPEHSRADSPRTWCQDLTRVCESIRIRQARKAGPVKPLTRGQPYSSTCLCPCAAWYSATICSCRCAGTWS
jgi:hypothetical protein